MRKYSSYKDSGLTWLGDIPENWRICRNKQIFHEVSDSNSTGEETLLTVSHITGVTPRSEKNVNMFFAESMTGYKRAFEGDLIINTMWAWMGALGVTTGFGICSPSYNVYRHNRGIDYSPKYFDHLFRTPNFIMEMTRFSKGIVESRLRLYPKDFFRIQTCLPTLSEQTAIANYLDTKTQAIDKKVNLLKKKIGYYQELRRSLINETVTNGLDKNVKLKNSGIAWIGKIPEHWETKRLKEIGRIETSSVNKKIEENEELVRLVNYVDVYNNPNKEILNSQNYMTVSANKLQVIAKKLKKGDALFTPSSETLEDIGVSAIVMENLENTLYSYHLIRLRFTKKIDLNFKKYMLNNDFVQYYFSHSATGTTRKILGLSTINNLPVLIPPTLKEQKEIADFLVFKSRKIDQIVLNIQTQIKTLKELRKTLINDAVTGKIKVIND